MTPRRLAALRALAERGATPGEREAAREALRRAGAAENRREARPKAPFEQARETFSRDFGDAFQRFAENMAAAAAAAAAGFARAAEFVGAYPEYEVGATFNPFSRRPPPPRNPFAGAHVRASCRIESASVDRAHVRLRSEDADRLRRSGEAVLCTDPDDVSFAAQVTHWSQQQPGAFADVTLARLSPNGAIVIAYVDSDGTCTARMADQRARDLASDRDRPHLLAVFGPSGTSFVLGLVLEVRCAADPLRRDNATVRFTPYAPRPAP